MRDRIGNGGHVGSHGLVAARQRKAWQCNASRHRSDPHPATRRRPVGLRRQPLSRQPASRPGDRPAATPSSAPRRGGRRGVGLARRRADRHPPARAPGRTDGRVRSRRPLGTGIRVARRTARHVAAAVDQLPHRRTTRRPVRAVRQDPPRRDRRGRRPGDDQGLADPRSGPSQHAAVLLRQSPGPTTAGEGRQDQPDQALVDS